MDGKISQAVVTLGLSCVQKQEHSKIRQAAAVFSTAGVLYLVIKRWTSKMQDASTVPSAGSALGIFIRMTKAKNLENLFKHVQQEQGDIFRVSLPFDRKAVVVNDIDSIHGLIASKPDMAMQKPPAWEALHGLTVQDMTGNPHKIWRRVLNAALSPRAFDSYVPKLVAAHEDMWKQLGSRGKQVIIREEVRRTQLRVMVDIFYGAQFSDEQTFNQLYDDYEAEVAGLMVVPVNLPGTAFHKAVKAAERIRNWCEELWHKEVRKQGVSGHTAQTSRDSHKPLRNAMQAIVELHMSPDEEVRTSVANEQLVLNHLLFLLEAAHSTVSFGTTHLIAELHRKGHEEYLANARREVLALLGGEGGVGNWDSGSLTYKMMMEMKFCAACINETLRLYPSAVIVSRKLPEGQKLEVLGKTIHGPIGVYASFGQTFTDPKFFPRPLEFLPDRWLPDASPTIAVSESARRAFLPFGIGVHTCPGQSLARLSMQAALVSLFVSRHQVQIMEELERVPTLTQAWLIANGGVAQISLDDGI